MKSWNGVFGGGHDDIGRTSDIADDEQYMDYARVRLQSFSWCHVYYGRCMCVVAGLIISAFLLTDLS